MSGQITPAHVATALVAACRLCGVDPQRAFDDGHGRARVMAAAACVARLGWSKGAAARVFRVSSTRLAPSMLAQARVFTDQLLEVAEALEAAGLTGGAPAGAPPGPLPPAAEPEVPRKAETAGAGAGSEADATPVAPAETDGADPVSCRPSPPRRIEAARGEDVDRRPRSRSAAPRANAARVERLKSVTPAIARWGRQQRALGADMDFVAWCFGVSADDLIAATDEPAARDLAA